MKHKLNDNLTLIYNNYFPKRFQTKTIKQNIIHIGIGGNIGDMEKRFQKLLSIFQQHNLINLIQTSPLLINPAFGYIKQNNFYNAVISISSIYSAKELLKFLLWVEKRFKRVRLFKDGPRTLDLDIIFYNNDKINTKSLKVPHLHWKKRDSVIIPLLFMDRIW